MNHATQPRAYAELVEPATLHHPCGVLARTHPEGHARIEDQRRFLYALTNPGSLPFGRMRDNHRFLKGPEIHCRRCKVITTQQYFIERDGYPSRSMFILFSLFS